MREHYVFVGVYLTQSLTRQRKLLQEINKSCNADVLPRAFAGAGDLVLPEARFSALI